MIKPAENLPKILREVFSLPEIASQTCRQLAENTGYNPTTIWVWTKGRSKAPIRGIEDILNAYGYELTIRRKG